MSKSITIIGAGPAGLFAAEQLAATGHAVTVFDRMPSVARKFLLAGRGGLNLTHSEPLETFNTRYGAAAFWLEPALRAFPPTTLCAWCEGLGQPTFVGSSGRIFPQAMKASPLLRAWLRRLDALGVTFRLRHRWLGWRDGALLFTDATGQEVLVRPAATLLALGGASWPRMGSDGGWTHTLAEKNIAVAPLRPANCGFVVPWSDYFAERFAGQPLKPVAADAGNGMRQGEIIITRQGLEGGLIYALSAQLRDRIAQNGHALLTLDLRPHMTRSQLMQKLATVRSGESLSGKLRRAGFAPLAAALLRECLSAEKLKSPGNATLAGWLKALPVRLSATAPLARAISSAGGIKRQEFNDDFMLTAFPGVFAAGEMLDWEAPTGGYLLQSCFSTGHAAAQGMMKWLAGTAKTA